ncbi:MAG: peptidase domain-containing ABC transporter [Nostocaceae cyanobacterium]|nr:peptidase domain-containing ABC transporter [Nostocaceae cyanobacterium]
MKYQVVLQHNTEDCGAACLASIAKYYGRIFTINRTREATGTGQLGTTLLNLKQGAQVLGFNARGVKATLELVDRKSLPLPAIIHWKGNHWVVLYGCKGKKYIIADPAVGLQYLTKAELLAGWHNGVMLLLETRADFYQAPDDRDKKTGIYRFFGRVWGYSAIIGEVLLLNLALGLISLTSPFLIQILTDDVLIRGDRQLLTSVIIAVLVFNFISTALRYVQANLIAHFAQRLELDMILEFARVILRLPLPYYETHRSGEVVSRVRDIQEINQLISQVGVTLPGQFFVALVSFCLMIFYSWKLTTFPLILAGVMTISTLVFLPRIRRKIQNVLIIGSENQGVLLETFKGAIVLKITNSAPYFWEELQSRYGQLAHASFRAMQIAIINNNFSSFISNTGRIILLWFGSILVIDKELTIGQLLAFNTLSGNFLTFILTILNYINPFTRTQMATTRLVEVIDSTPEVAENSQKPIAKINTHTDIICTNINFHHPGRPELLQDFFLNIPGGKVTAIIGQSGCGKSTLAKLIAGLYQPQSGNISIGLYNLSDLALTSWREQVMLVPQEAHFWSRTILANFRLASPQVTFTEIVEACHIAKADEFINKLPNKYETILGEFGTNISGGQRQRLAIARAIIANPAILILDESTSSLDPISETQVLDRLLQHRKEKTTILISHRPRVINRADWIIFLEQGRVKMQGKLEELKIESGEHLDFLTP